MKEWGLNRHIEVLEGPEQRRRWVIIKSRGANQTKGPYAAGGFKHELDLR
jgi:hypothetical protein